MSKLIGKSAAQPDGPALFRLRNLQHRYPDGTLALSGVNLDIFPGDRLLLAGPNGAGKTTLAKHLNGLLLPEAGEISYRGQPLAGLHLERARLEIGLLFQDPDDQLFCNSVREDVLFGPRNQGLDPNAAEAAADAALRAVGLADAADRSPHSLSYGQRKRAALATLLAMQPTVLVLDEPTVNLDPRQKRLLLDQLQTYCGVLICITHDLLFAGALCKRAVTLRQGQVHCDRALQERVAHAPPLRAHDPACSLCRAGDTPGPRLVSNAAPPAMNRADPRPLLAMTGYSYRYPDGREALQDVNLTINQGERLAIVGENGAGKSTLAACLAGLRSGQGLLALNGRPVDRRRRNELGLQTGLVFQEPADQLCCPTCREEVAFGLRQRRWPQAVVARAVCDALRQVGLPGFEERVPLHLSHGERKRLALAAVLVMRPAILILDEPTAGLDPQGEALLLELLADLDLTLLVISHDWHFISHLTERTLIMHEGRIVRDDATDTFFAVAERVDLNQHAGALCRWNHSLPAQC